MIDDDYYGLEHKKLTDLYLDRLYKVALVCLGLNIFTSSLAVILIVMLYR